MKGKNLHPLKLKYEGSTIEGSIVDLCHVGGFRFWGSTSSPSSLQQRLQQRLGCYQGLGKDIDCLLISADVVEIDVSRDDALSNIVIVHLNVLRLGMEDRISG